MTKSILVLAIIVCGLMFQRGALAADSPPAELLLRANDRLELLTVDLSEDTDRQLVIERGTAEVYQGHPTTLLLPDGETMYCVWTIGHGGHCGPMKRSDDGGKSWGPLLDLPDNWVSTFNCPAIYRLSDPQGRSRLFVFAGRGPDGSMHESHSYDDGRTWSPMRSLDLPPCVMPFCTIMPVDDGQRLLGMTNLRRPGETQEKRSNVLAQSYSSDGGLSWSRWEIVQDVLGLMPCEPEIVRSPDGGRLLCLIRENTRRAGGLFMVSDDEGRTWSAMKPLPPGLHGDRHKAVYLSDGRLVIAFRDTCRQSPTRNHFVAWVGRFEDILVGRDGQYRVKLLHSHRGGDCGYPGLELLPDGTIIATTYVKYRPGPEKNSVVSVRFCLDETDKLAAAEEVPRAKIVEQPPRRNQVELEEGQQ